MSLDSDIVLFGSGVAPLVAASKLISEGKKVLLLNPDWDFFLENSELPLDPIWPANKENLSVDNLQNSLRKRALSELRPDFPGAIELWEGTQPGDQKEGYRDFGAPHVRTRSRMWLASPLRQHQNREQYDAYWDLLENLYVEASDRGLNPQIVQGSSILKFFPGAPEKVQNPEDYRAIVIPKMCDVDVSRYRNGLLEYIRERLGKDRVITAASQIEFIPEGIRFHSGKKARTAKIKEGMFVFWTPRLTAWIMHQAKKMGVSPIQPRGVRLWEEWTLLSREKINHEVVGAFEDTIVWAEVEGAPDLANNVINRMKVLKAGELIDIAATATSWANTDSFMSLSRLCHDFLHWDKFTMRELKSRSILEWNNKSTAGFSLLREPFPVYVVTHSDGPLVDVVKSSRNICSSVFGEK